MLLLKFHSVLDEFFRLCNEFSQSLSPQIVVQQAHADVLEWMNSSSFKNSFLGDVTHNNQFQKLFHGNDQVWDTISVILMQALTFILQIL